MSRGGHTETNPRGKEGTRRDGGECWVGEAPGRQQHSPEGAEVVLMLRVTAVWLTGDGDALAAGGTAGGKGPAPSASSLTGSAWRGREREREDEFFHQKCVLHVSRRTAGERRRWSQMAGASI